MNQLHTDTLHFHVKFTGIPAHMIPVNKLPGVIQIKIQATGFRLLMNRIKKTWRGKSLIINLEKELTRKKHNSLGFSFRSKKNEINDQLGKHITILAIEPDSVHIQFDLKASRKVPVVIKSEWQFERGYGQSGHLIITPDSIEIIGSHSEVQQTDSVYTFTLRESQINKSITRFIGINLPAGIQSQQSEVSVHLPVERVSEKQFTCRIEIVADKANSQIELLQSEATVKVLIPNSIYHLISSDDFKLGIYAREASAGLPRLIVRILNKPANVQIMEISPPSVEYLIKAS